MAPTATAKNRQTSKKDKDAAKVFFPVASGRTMVNEADATKAKVKKKFRRAGFLKNYLSTKAYLKPRDKTPTQEELRAQQKIKDPHQA